MSNGSKQSSRSVLIAGLWMAAIMVVAGCASAPNPPAIPDGPKSVDFDRALLADCAKLPKLEGGTDVQIKNHYEQMTKLYSECATMKGKLNREVRKAFNIQ